MTAMYNAFNNDESRGGRTLTRAAHLFPWVIVAIVVVRSLELFGAHHWLLTVIDLACIAAAVVALLHRSTTRLCVQCMEDVPADAPIRAQHRRTALWFHHAITGFKFLPWLFGTVVLAVIIDQLTDTRLDLLPNDLLFVGLLYSAWQHHKLRPWCPYCRDWGEDGHIHEPSPDPTVKATR